MIANEGSVYVEWYLDTEGRINWYTWSQMTLELCVLRYSSFLGFHIPELYIKNNNNNTNK